MELDWGERASERREGGGGNERKKKNNKNSYQWGKNDKSKNRVFVVRYHFAAFFFCVISISH
jgi:hypothetical protein